MDYLRKITLPCLMLSCLVASTLFSSAVYAEKFVAKVKFTLVDPVSVTTNVRSETIEIPLKKHATGTCSLTPGDGRLAGNACDTSSNTSTSTSAQITLGGSKDQMVAVNVDQISTPSTIAFQPEFFNGTNSDTNFQLNASNHTIYVGGTVSKSSISKLHNVRREYDVEVLYP